MMNHHHVAVDIQAMLNGADPPISGHCCIYKVPFPLRRLNEEAYTPKVVSIGPFHYLRHPYLQNMERHKFNYCNTFLRRGQANLDSFVGYIQEMESNIRRCYSETIHLSREEFVKVILVDSCFILELFYRCYHMLRSMDDNALLSKARLYFDIESDLLLLENQLPFFVLENLFNLAFPSDEIPSFIQLTFDYFSCYNRCHLLASNNITISHFTDLIRTFHLQNPPDKRPLRINESVAHLPSATELVEAGVKFKVNTESKCLLDLRFSRGVLEIPELKVDDLTELMFRNMVALEQCHYHDDAYITDYVSVWDFLINTSRDVNVLVRKRILVNWLGDSDSVANLFNGLTTNIWEENFSSHYFHLCKNLNDYYGDPWHKSKATLRRDYCRTRWQTAASIAGIVLLILTLLQSVCSVLQVIQGSKI